MLLLCGSVRASVSLEPRENGKPVVGRSRSGRLGASRLSNSMRNLSGAESVCADAESELFSGCNW